MTGLTLAWLIACRGVVSIELAVVEPSPAGVDRAGCFYFDQGRSWNESDSVCFAYERSRPKEFRRYRVPLGNWVPLHRLRFDPLPSVGAVAVRAISVSAGAFERSVDLRAALGRTLYDVHATRSTIDGNELSIRLLADDPHLVVVDDLAGWTHALGLLSLALSLPAAWLLVQAFLRLARTARRRHVERQAWLLVPATLAFGGSYAGALWFAYPIDLSFEVAVRDRSARQESLRGCFFHDDGQGFSEEGRTCFRYDRHPIDEFQPYHVRIRSVADVRRLRLDPAEGPGLVVLRNVRITSAGVTRTLDPAHDLGHRLYPLSNSRLESRGVDLIVRMTGNDPYFMLYDGLGDRGSDVGYRVFAAAIFAAVGGAALAAGLRFAGPRALRFLAARLPRIRRATSVFARTSAVGFVVAALGLKLFVLSTSAARYGRTIAAAEWLLAPSSDLLVFVAASMMLWLLGAFDRVLGKSPGASPCRLLVAAVEGAMGVALWMLAAAYLLSGYVFWEWGGFLEGSALYTLYRSPVPDSVRHYLAQPAFFGVLVSAFACVAISLAVHRRVHAAGRGWQVFVLVAALWACGAVAPIRNPYAFDAAVPSPLFLALRQEALTSTDLGFDAPPDLPENPVRPRKRPVPAPFDAYRGIAADRDLILVVLESVRRSNLELYGYERSTMPNLARMASRGLVFQNAYASQPRSSKTLDALMLGVDPDPRMEPFTWTPERVAGTRHFPGILRDLGYRSYFGIGWDPATDGFLDFVTALWGSALDRVVGVEDLVTPGGEVTLTDDERLVDDFLSWYERRRGKTAALIWLQGGHHPYLAPRKKFPERSPVDRYDNCLYSVDLALGRLARGLERLERRPVVAIFGDHGEAFGEHAGDILHGNLLYDQSIRVPFVLLLGSPSVAERVDVDARFSMKDVPATLLYLLGIEESLGQSEVIFSKTSRDKVYLSTVYGDYKLGLIDGNHKLMLRPSRRIRYLFDLSADPAEQRNIVAELPPATVRAMETDLVSWYFSQIDYLERRYPRSETAQR